MAVHNLGTTILGEFQPNIWQFEFLLLILQKYCDKKPMEKLLYILAIAFVALTGNAQSCHDERHPHLIDLGMPSGTLWACCNVDTEHPEWQSPDNYGGYFAWGETEEKDYYDWCTYVQSNGSSGSCFNLGNEIAGTKLDVAQKEWGRNWHIPTSWQIEELVNNCSYRWTTMNGIYGARFTGPNGKSIFLPAAGARHDTGNSSFSKFGYYWSGTPDSRSETYSLVFDKDRCNCYGNQRRYGFTIRPVTNGMKGDTNGDGHVSVTDVMKLVSRCMGAKDDGFFVVNADVNGDNDITVADVMATVDIILNSGGHDDEGFLSGTWHLGYWVCGTRKVHFDGTEEVSFLGKNMYWTGRQDGSSNHYAIAYDDDYKSFVATDANKRSEASRLQIIKYSQNLLVLRFDDADRYFYPSIQEAQEAQLELGEPEPPSHTETDDINTILSYASNFTKSGATRMGVHYENARASTENDRQWLMNADNEPSCVSELTQWKAHEVTLYPYGIPSPADVNQHAIGDCSACAVFASMAYLYPDFIKSIITDNGNNTYTVKMYDPQGLPIEVCVSNKILCNSDGYIGQVTGKNNAITWATILEKAFMKWQTRYQMYNVEGIGTEYLAPLFTGNGASYSISNNLLHPSELKLFVEWALRHGMMIIGGFDVGGLKFGELESVTGHAFTFMMSSKENTIFTMRNPWGITSADGILEIPNDQAIVRHIGIRATYPGAAITYLRKNIGPYSPPAFKAKKTDLGVSKRLMAKHKSAAEKMNSSK